MDGCSMDECRSKLDGAARGIALRGFWHRESAGAKATTIEGKFCEHSSYFKLNHNNSHRSGFRTHFQVSLKRFQKISFCREFLLHALFLQYFKMA